MDPVHDRKVDGIAIRTLLCLLGFHVTKYRLQLDPQRFLQILHLPIRAMRVITDPVVDTVAFFVVDLLFPPLLRLARQLVAYLFLSVINITTKTLGRSTADMVTKLVTNIVSPFTALKQLLISGIGKSHCTGGRQAPRTTHHYHDCTQRRNATRRLLGVL